MLWRLVYASTPSVRDAFFDRVDIALSAWKEQRRGSKGRTAMRMDDDVDGIFDIGDLSDDEPAPQPQSYGRSRSGQGESNGGGQLGARLGRDQGDESAGSAGAPDDWGNLLLQFLSTISRRPDWFSFVRELCHTV